MKSLINLFQACSTVVYARVSLSAAHFLIINIILNDETSVPVYVREDALRLVVHCGAGIEQPRLLRFVCLFLQALRADARSSAFQQVTTFTRVLGVELHRPCSEDGHVLAPWPNVVSLGQRRIIHRGLLAILVLLPLGDKVNVSLLIVFLVVA